MSKNTLKVNELRVGNWVFDSDGFEAKIHGIKPFDHSCRCDEEEGCLLCMDIYPPDGTIRKEYIDSLLDCSPIPITDEWLNRLGFWYSEEFGGRGFMIDNFILYKVSNGFDSIDDIYFELEWIPNNFHFSERSHVKSNIRYVHEVQNLFSILTGEELRLSQVKAA